ncbi:hypothetical protein SAMN04488134_109146 [Amphibacillus marinus]|uniref:DUF4367 domain-containing protein n=1 Tax=Amphibacillus marinus TaxID=872970 RepID=A0A1H8R473_9BACI|nr:hypothetical protein [Amphibacillus marinus]SEO61192.1 hypothetical protein SAMN04488134_109146 [Amphibacillus marinus]
MKEWKTFFWFTLLVLLVGCQATEQIPEGYYDYEKAPVAEAISTVSFNPETPQYVPMQVEFIISDPYQISGTTYEALDISFYSRNNDLLTYQVTDGFFEELADGEIVELDRAINGQYMTNDFAQVLVWEKDGLSYKLEFRSSIIGKEASSGRVTKAELLKVAQSFQL